MTPTPTAPPPPPLLVWWFRNALLTGRHRRSSGSRGRTQAPSPCFPGHDGSPSCGRARAYGRSCPGSCHRPRSARSWDLRSCNSTWRKSKRSRRMNRVSRLFILHICVFPRGRGTRGWGRTLERVSCLFPFTLPSYMFQIVLLGVDVAIVVRVSAFVKCLYVAARWHLMITRSINSTCLSLLRCRRGCRRNIVILHMLKRVKVSGFASSATVCKRLAFQEQRCKRFRAQNTMVCCHVAVRSSTPRNIK